MLKITIKMGGYFTIHSPDGEKIVVKLIEDAGDRGTLVGIAADTSYKITRPNCKKKPVLDDFGCESFNR